MPDNLTHSLQENLITILAFDKEQGGIVSKLLDVTLMDGDYRLIAERCIDYWRHQKMPPDDHLADLFADILEDKHNRRAAVIRRHIRSMIALSESINTKYVMQQLRDHNKLQRFKAGVVEAAELISKKAQMALPEIEELWNRLLRTREIDFSGGMQLREFPRVLQRLEELSSEFRMGISELDRRGVVPARGKLLIMGGAAGRGKTWGLIHVGKQAIINRQRVVHISLEIDEEEVLGRYYQSLFSVAKRPSEVEITELEIDEDGKLEGFARKEHVSAFALGSGTSNLELDMHIRELGKKADYLWVKRFKPDELTANGLRAYLDMLEATEGFIPDMIIVDYLGIMKIDPKDKRGSIGRNCVDLRSVAIERNAALVTAHQLSKKGEEAPMAKGTHFSEDWSIMGTADVALIYSVTDLEFAYGLGRLYVAKARSEEDRFAILITQSYKVGQFCLESMYLQRQYRDLLDDLKTSSDHYDASDDGGEEDEEKDGDE